MFRFPAVIVKWPTNQKRSFTVNKHRSGVKSPKRSATKSTVAVRTTAVRTVVLWTNYASDGTDSTDNASTSDELLVSGVRQTTTAVLNPKFRKFVRLSRTRRQNSIAGRFYLFRFRRRTPLISYSFRQYNTDTLTSVRVISKYPDWLRIYLFIRAEGLG